MRDTIVAILNAASGSADDNAPARLAAVFEEARTPARIIMARSGADIVAETKKAVSEGARVVAAGGGDGTISSVASVLSGAGVPLGVLPLGTLNHFARDLGIPADLDSAARVLLDGRVASVDVCEVNGRIFVNTSSLGVYPMMVQQRELRQALGQSKWRAIIPSVLAALHWRRNLTLRIEVAGETMLRRTPLVFIGNNVYKIEGPGLGSRTSLDQGCMTVLVLHGAGRLSVLRFALNALLGRLDRASNYDALCALDAWIESRRPRLQVALDGEVTYLDTPLHYRVRPGALRVMLP
jgi:diacylglycerol kinase family enzyme